MLEIITDLKDFEKIIISDAVVKVTGQTENLSAEINAVTRPVIKSLNSEFRGVDAITDVLSFPTIDGVRGRSITKKEFPFDYDAERKSVFIGSVAICSARAKEQAKKYGHSYQRELHYLAVHGLLHLLGYDHMTEKDKTEMRKKEEEILKIAGMQRTEL